MTTFPRVTVEVPLLRLGSGASDYAKLGSYVYGLRNPKGLHMTLLHVGILNEFARDVSEWTNGITDAETATRKTVEWLHALPILQGFSGRSDKLIGLADGRVSGLEVEVPRQVHEFQVNLVEALHQLLDELLVDNIDDFILSSPALGYRYPRWTPHVAVGRPPHRSHETWDIEPLALEFGPSQIRNGRFLPSP